MSVLHTIEFTVTRIQQHIEDQIPRTRGLLEGHILIDGEPFAPQAAVNLSDLCSFFSRAKTPRFSFSHFAPLTCTCGVPECSNWCSINWSQADGVVTWTIPADELAHSRYKKHTSTFDLNPDGSLTLQFDQRQYLSAVHSLQEAIAQHLLAQPCALLAEDFDTTSASEWAALLFKWNRKVEKLLTEHSAIRRFHDQSLQLGLGSFQNQTVQLAFPVYALLYILSPSFTLASLRETLENYDLTALATALAHSPDAFNYLNITSMDNREQHPSSQELDALWNHWKLKPTVAFIR